MGDKDNEKNNEQNNEENINVEDNDNNEDVREEEEIKDEIKDNIYVNDDIIEKLNALEKKFDGLNDKLDSMISMSVDSGAIIHENINDSNSNSADDYAEDFINLDELDLAL